MKHLRAFLLPILGLAISAQGQTSGSAPDAKPAKNEQQGQASRPMAPRMSTIAEVVDLQVTQLENRVMSLAEAMPEDKFDFNPTNLNLADSRSPVRTFAGQLKHLATDNYAIWSPMTGDAMPAGIKNVDGPEDLKTRAEILKFVKDSFALGHKAAATLTSENAVEALTFRGTKAARLFLATFAIEHAQDHCGQLAVYLRLSGITPPGSRK